MNAIAKIRPHTQAEPAPDVRKDEAILAALDALVRAQNAYKSGCHHAANLHVAFAARKLIAGSMPEAA
ncbi:hypothetical protein [Oceanicaulis alexandrii]|uniref:hypothetical protein n=1 Tax=Oceanicaulis alexandrii TaxID=153233 RepID=UPI003B507409